MPDWVKHAIWWQVYPLGFTSAEAASERAPVTHRLSQLTGWLDYAVNLGASGIALGPVFAAQTHGYDTSTTTGSTPGSATSRISRPWSRPRTRAGCGCCLTGSSTTWAGTSRPSAGCWSRARPPPRPPGSG